MKLILSFLLIFTFLSLDAYSNDKSSKRKGNRGWRESYGGDSVISEFLFYSREIFYLNQFSKTTSIDYQLVEVVVSDLEVECSSQLILDGKKKHAINYPNSIPQRLLLDCLAWKENLTIQQKKLLVIHELLPLLKIEDIDYKLSNEIYSNYRSLKLSSQRSSSLYFSIYDCNVEKYFDALERGEDVFQITQDGDSLLILAIKHGCSEIALDLMNYRIPIKNSSASKQRISIVFHLALDVLNELTDWESRKMLLQKLVKIYPEVVDDLIPTSIELTDSLLLDRFYVGNRCHKDSNPLHYLASARPEMMLVDGQISIQDKRTIESNIRFLVKLGFNLKQRNVCGETPQMLMLKNNLKI